VEVGQVVEKGQVLCIVEAMKLMNEIEAEYRCKIVRIAKENAQPVEFGEALFVVEPL
jgi:acetyl-CoA carboxylase biotin carboxyl carrier protein